jgi:hypothetical protein
LFLPGVTFPFPYVDRCGVLLLSLLFFLEEVELLARLLFFSFLSHVGNKIDIAFGKTKFLLLMNENKIDIAFGKTKFLCR